MGTAFDITVRKKAEQTLTGREERLRLLIEDVRDYKVFMLDPKGQIVIQNRWQYFRPEIVRAASDFLGQRRRASFVEEFILW